jgi:hypothetical protein
MRERETWLIGELLDGPRRCADVLAAARRHGWSERSVYRAAATLRRQHGMRTKRTPTFPSGAVWEGTWQDWRVVVTKRDEGDFPGPRGDPRDRPEPRPIPRCRCKRPAIITDLDGEAACLTCGRARPVSVQRDR